MKNNISDFSDMPLTQVVQKYTKLQEWGDEIEVNEERTNSELGSSIGINNQACRFYIQVDENSEQIKVFLYTPFSVPPSRMPEVARLLNIINSYSRLGCFACADDDESNPIRFLAIIDVEGGVVSVEQIATMMSAAVQRMEGYFELFSVLTFTKRKALAVWKEFIEAEQKVS
mgnify:CR=1 FL=1|jgi:hypothetical protein